MIIIPFGIIFLIIGYVTYRMNVEAAEKIERRRIENRLSEIERRKASIESGEPAPPPSRTRRIRSRR